MRSNKQLIKKADLALQDLIDDGGYLEEKQARQFIRTAIDQPTLMNVASIRPMDREKQSFAKIKFGQRISHPAEEYTATADTDGKSPTTDKVQLDVVRLKAVVKLSYEDLWFNIEQEQLRDTIRDMIAERCALDMEELAVQGDTGSGDSFLALQDGLRQQALANGHVYDHEGNPVNRSLFKAMVKNMPSQYKRALSQMRFLSSTNTELEWRDTLAQRGTSLGDTAQTSQREIPAYGCPLLRVATIPEDITADADGDGQDEDGLSYTILTHPKNVVYGVHKEIMLESDKDIDAGEYIIVARYNVNIKFMEPDAVVIGKNVKVW